MKKIILLPALFFSLLSFAQKLTVTPTGLKDAADLERTFVVIPAEGKTAKQLYDEAIKFINKNYKNPEEVIKGKIDGEYLKFETFAPDFLIIKTGGYDQPYNAKYRTELSFKDGKIKYEIIELEMFNEAKSPLLFTGGSAFVWSIYNKKGELKKEGVNTNIENYFNNRIGLLMAFLQGKTTDDKW